MEQILMWWVAVIDFPAIILLLMCLLFAWVLWKTQANEANGFDFADMLRDEQGKPSSARMAVFVCLGITTWGLMYITIKTGGQVDPLLFLGYTVIWSGQKIAEKLIEAWSGRSSQSSSVTTRTAGSETTASQSSSSLTPPDNDSR